MRNSLTTAEKYTIMWFQSVINVENSSLVKKKDYTMSESLVKQITRPRPRPSSFLIYLIIKVKNYQYRLHF
ncbi:hypothetical protein BH23THE1_BH23THE1_10630 [soil metagenome]